jgi:hypothetical protein
MKKQQKQQKPQYLNNNPNNLPSISKTYAPHVILRNKLKNATYKTHQAATKTWDKTFCVKTGQMSALFS